MAGEETRDATYPGQRGLTDNTSKYNAVEFVVRMLMGQQATATLVQVKSVDPSGLGPNTGVVSVQPMVNQMDAQGTATPHGTIFNLPYFRLQGGANAVIMDPVVGDIGIAVFASRDISAVKATRAVANPSSWRRFDLADGLYLGGFLNGDPQQYVAFTAEGINIVSPTAIRLQAPDITIHASNTLKYDADGNGVAITSTTRTDYGIGSTGSSQPIHPPEIP